MKMLKKHEPSVAKTEKRFLKKINILGLSYPMAVMSL
jgi:hypothetical protein